MNVVRLVIKCRLCITSLSFVLIGCPDPSTQALRTLRPRLPRSPSGQTASSLAKCCGMSFPTRPGCRDPESESQTQTLQAFTSPRRGKSRRSRAEGAGGDEEGKEGLSEARSRLRRCHHCWGGFGICSRRPHFTDTPCLAGWSTPDPRSRTTARAPLAPVPVGPAWIGVTA